MDLAARRHYTVAIGAGRKHLYPSDEGLMASLSGQDNENRQETAVPPPTDPLIRRMRLPGVSEHPYYLSARPVSSACLQLLTCIFIYTHTHK